MKQSEVTGLLAQWQQGDRDALDQLTPRVYEELRRLARSRMRSERADHTLQATALVNEAFMKLVGTQLNYQSRQHFFAMAASVMRRVLVDHARKRATEKRAGDWQRVPLDESAFGNDPAPVAIIELDEALEKLAAFDLKMANAVELIFFGGMTYEESASVLQMSRTALYNEVKMAKAWLANQLADHSA